MDDLKLRLKFFLETYGEGKFCNAVTEVLNEQADIAQEEKYQIPLLPKEYEVEYHFGNELLTTLTKS